MTHDHDHAGHLHEPPNSNAAFAIGVVLNLGFVVAEVVYGLAAHSLALISDAGHNLSDVFCLLLAWGAMHLTRAAPTKRRTYGWRRSSILAAVINAVVLVVVVGGSTAEASCGLCALLAGIDPHAVEEYLTNLAGVTAVHDLHIWAMSTTEVALTVHLVMAQTPRNDLFLHDVGDVLRDRFGIGHATTQIECGNCERDCRQAPVHVV